MKRFIPLILLVLSATSGAAIVNLEWTNATQNVDGTPIVATGPGSLATTKINWGACNPDDTPAEPLLEKIVPTTVPGASETTDITIWTPGRWCFLGYHTNVGDPANSIDPQTSDASNPVFKQIIMVPEPPQNLMVGDPETIVWDIVKQDDKYVFLGVGTVPNGTPCDPNETVNGYYAVPNDAVTWFGNVRPPVVVADCS